MDGRVSVNRQRADRRREVRLEVVGDLWARLDARTTFRLIDLSRGGALIECGHPLTPGSGYDIRLTAGGETSIIPVTVRRVELPARGGGYRIGLEFLELTPFARRHVDGLLAARAGAPGFQG